MSCIMTIELCIIIIVQIQTLSFILACVVIIRAEREAKSKRFQIFFTCFMLSVLNKESFAVPSCVGYKPH